MATTTTESRERTLARRLVSAKRGGGAVAAPKNEAATQDLLAKFWVGVDTDNRGNPQMRVQAVTCARRLLDIGVGARRAAQLFGREAGDNGAQRYFDAAAGLRDNLIKSAEIASTPISKLAALVRERRGTGRPNQSGIDRARRMYARLRSVVDREARRWNVVDLLRQYARTRRWPDPDAVVLLQRSRRRVA